MILPRIILFLLVVHALGCASGLQRHEASQTSPEKEPQEQKKENATPTFTYRPGRWGFSRLDNLAVFCRRKEAKGVKSFVDSCKEQEPP
jgi:hypothetical protein